ncbi:MAG: exodeoxyribonuclease V subunit alpha [Spirochaetales bacterium]|nr:exodeoxyribonuclease V subunit alpha [Spirochaetales bacterium]
MKQNFQEATDFANQELAVYLKRRFQASDEVVTWALAVHQSYREGHTALAVPEPPAIEKALNHGGHSPLTWADGLLSFTRCFHEEERLAQRFAALAKYQPRPSEIQGHRIEALTLNSLQAAATYLPFFFQLGILTGGPGTGKTTVLAQLLVHQFADRQARGLPLPRIALAAPTGKAAFRMGESLRNALCKIPAEFSALLATLEPQTLHRLLGIRSAVGAPKYHSEHPFDADLIVIDEASMISLTLMDQLLDALPESATLILMGDPDQLSSVEPGNVLGDLTKVFAANSFSADWWAMTGSPTGHEKSYSGTPSPLVKLEHSYRFSDDKEIGRLAQLTLKGETEPLSEFLTNLGTGGQVSLHALDAGAIENFAASYSLFLAAQTPEAALEALNHHMLLTLTNEGPWGQRTLNELLFERFSKEKPLSLWPVMITENDPRLNLFNGDLGVAFRTDRVRVYFQRSDKKPAVFLENQLPSHTIAFAMTIHKSQGSEFAHVSLVIPEVQPEGFVPTRQLFYTGLTRAKEQVSLWMSEKSVQQSVQTQEIRQTGLVSKLHHQLKLG